MRFRAPAPVRVTVAIIALCLFAAPSASSQPRYAEAAGAVAGNGELVVTFTQKGVKKAPVTYHLDAVGDAEYSCGGTFSGSVLWGGPGWSDDVTFTKDHGRIEGQITFRVASGGLSPCATGLRLDSVSYTRIKLTSSDGTEALIADVSRQF